MRVAEVLDELSKLAIIRTQGDQIRIRPRKPEYKPRVWELVCKLRPHKKQVLSLLEEKQRRQFFEAVDRLASEFPEPPKEVERLSEEQKERFALMAVCGGLIDEGALKWIH